MAKQLGLFEDPEDGYTPPKYINEQKIEKEKQPNPQTLETIKKIQEGIDNGEITLKEEITKHGIRIITLSVGEEEIGRIGNGPEQNYWEIGRKPLEIREDYRNQGLGTFLLYLSLKQALEPKLNPQRMIKIIVGNPRIKHMLDNLGIEYRSKTIIDPSEAPYESKTGSQIEIVEIMYSELKVQMERLERMLRS